MIRQHFTYQVFHDTIDGEKQLFFFDLFSIGWRKRDIHVTQKFFVFFLIVEKFREFGNGEYNGDLVQGLSIRRRWHLLVVVESTRRKTGKTFLMILEGVIVLPWCLAREEGREGGVVMLLLMYYYGHISQEVRRTLNMTVNLNLVFLELVAAKEREMMRFESRLNDHLVIEMSCV